MADQATTLDWKTGALPQLLQRLIDANVHKACRIQKALEYARLWQQIETIKAPEGSYYPILVDRTLELERFIEVRGFVPVATPNEFASAGAAKLTEELDVERYVAFVRFPGPAIGSSTYVHINTREGFFFSLLYPDVLERSDCDCLGSFRDNPAIVAHFSWRLGKLRLSARECKPKPRIDYAMRHRYYAPIF